MTDAAPSSVTSRTDGAVTVITIDDGKANALSHSLIADISAAIVSAADAKALVIAGRPGRFCAGFDLAGMEAGPDSARALLGAGAELALQIYEHPAPTVVAATGHALAMGAILLLAFDVRIGQPGSFKIGMNEVNIGMPVPRFALELAADRLSRRHLHHATALAQGYDPEAAVDAGYFDRLADDPIAAAIAEGARLADHVSRFGFATTRLYERHAISQRARNGLVSDLVEFKVDPAR